VLKRRLGTFSAEQVAGYIDRSLADVARVEYLLRSLKSFNMHESPAIEPVHLATFFAQLESLLEPDLRQRAVALQLEPAPGTLWVQADPRALQQVMLNLTTNALDALEGVEGPRVRIEARERDGRVVIEVGDNGCGMSSEALQNLFKPFYTTKQSGTGLGMAIVKKALAKMNGFVEVDSLLGHGTRVRLELPRG
jgi:C4-dicarboxylate-specific signal transduction histidine kinase